MRMSGARHWHPGMWVSWVAILFMAGLLSCRKLTNSLVRSCAGSLGVRILLRVSAVLFRGIDVEVRAKVDIDSF